MKIQNGLTRSTGGIGSLETAVNTKSASPPLRVYAILERVHAILEWVYAILERVYAILQRVHVILERVHAILEWFILFIYAPIRHIHKSSVT